MLSWINLCCMFVIWPKCDHWWTLTHNLTRQWYNKAQVNSIKTVVHIPKYPLFKRTVLLIWTSYWYKNKMSQKNRITLVFNFIQSCSNSSFLYILLWKCETGVAIYWNLQPYMEIVCIILTSLKVNISYDHL